ncbi:MAG: hypothetical protein JWM16_565, partial [Verrucomicrobiales bacterium]|nr:hypothetical protein [Verrucomicrobiales bacterium]
MLPGYKTYITIIIGIIYIVGGRYLKLWPVDGELLAAIGLLAAGFLRAGLSSAHEVINAARNTSEVTLNAVRASNDAAPRSDGLGTKLGTLAILGTVCLAVMFGLSGCVTKPVVSTVPGGGAVTNLTRVPDVERIARVAGAAAELGSQAWLNEHPNDRRYFIVANEALKGLVNSANYDPAAFAQALQVLPMKELRGPQGSIYITA